MAGSQRAARSAGRSAAVAQDREPREVVAPAGTPRRGVKQSSASREVVEQSSASRGGVEAPPPTDDAVPDDVLQAAAYAADVDDADPIATVADAADGPAAEPSSAPQWRDASAAERSAVLADPLIKETLRLFDGAVVRVRRRLADTPPTEESTEPDVEG